MPVLRWETARPGYARGEDVGWAGVSTPSLSRLPQEIRDSADGDFDGEPDRGSDGAGDPAFDFFRSDWRDNWSGKPGYEGAAGFALYLKQAGIIGPSRQRRIKDKEVTGLDLDRTL